MNSSALAPPRTTNWVALYGMLIFALVLRVGCALYFKNLGHTDEIFQYTEPGHRAVFGYGIVTWEFRDGGRSWLLPGLVAGIIEAASVISDDPSVYLGAIGIVMSILSLSIVVVAFLWGNRLYGTTGALITAALAATWPELIYFAPKPLTDVIATDAFILAIFAVYPDTDERSRKAFFVAGLLLGLAFVLRFQIAPVLALFALLIARARWKDRWLPLVAGGVGPLLCSGLLDAFTWSYPFQSMIVPLSKAAGVAYAASEAEPFYWYAAVLALNWSGAIVLVIAMAWLGARRMPILAVIAVFTLAFYSLLGIKVYRYIYPALPLLIILRRLGHQRNGDMARTAVPPIRSRIRRDCRPGVADNLRCVGDWRSFPHLSDQGWRHSRRL